MRLTFAIVLALPMVARAAPLAAHHAEYTLSLMSTQDQDVLRASGSMSYDVTDACTGWTTAQHLVINLTNKDGQDERLVTDYATFETKDGTRLDFHTRQMTDQAVTQQVDGTATLDKPGGTGTAVFTSPQKKTILLPIGTLLPMAHTSALIDAATAGRKFLSVPLFDGTGDEGAQDTFVSMGAWGPPVQPSSGKWTALEAVPSGRVHIAFFTRTAATQTPDYEIGMRYYRNGVSDDLAMNFGDFTLAGALELFELRKPARC